jgi:hypothetical protein
VSRAAGAWGAACGVVFATCGVCVCVYDNIGVDRKLAVKVRSHPHRCLVCARVTADFHKRFASIMLNERRTACAYRLGRIYVTAMSRAVCTYLWCAPGMLHIVLLTYKPIFSVVHQDGDSTDPEAVMIVHHADLFIDGFRRTADGKSVKR